MTKRTKGLLIVLAALLVIAVAVWFVFYGGVSADVQGTANETTAAGSLNPDMVKIDDNVSAVTSGQVMSFTITVDSKKLFENLSGIISPTEQQFNDWISKNGSDKIYLNAWLGNGRKTSDNSWIIPGNPNFSVVLPAFQYSGSQLTYTATAVVPTNVNLKRNEIQNIARVIHHPCHVATMEEIMASTTGAKLKAGAVICPNKDKVRIAQNSDIDAISYVANTTDLGIVSYDVGNQQIVAGESAVFRLQYKNLSNQIANGSKLKIRFPQNTFSINDPSIKPAVKETIDGKIYDIYYINLGNVLPTVNGYSLTDTMKIAAIKTALQAALVGSTDASLTKAINDAIAIVDQYLAGTKTIADVTTAISAANTVATTAQAAAENTSVTTVGTSATPTSLIGRITAAILQLMHPVYIAPGFGSGTVAALSQAMQYATALAVGATTPAHALVIPFHATAISQSQDSTSVETYVELMTTSTDSDLSNNSAIKTVVISAPQTLVQP